MPPPLHDERPLWHRVAAAGALDRRFFLDDRERITLDAFARRSALSQREALRGASVLLRTQSQLTTSVGLLELDGLARRIVLCPPDLDTRYLPAVIADAEATAVVSDRPPDDTALTGLRPNMIGAPSEACSRDEEALATEWIMFTSGTTGRPKMVVHSLRSLTAAITPAASPPETVWSTFYDIRRYGGLQILLRALVGGGSIVLSSAAEPAGAFVERASAANVSHISGTPSHWRRATLSPSVAGFAPGYVRMSGEAADQAIIDKLHEVFPGAQVAHAFATTEAGVGFEVGDGSAGFPDTYIGLRRGVEISVVDGTLRIRSPGNATGYLGAEAGSFFDADGFVDTKDVVERRGDRYHFVGRRDGVINVGGLKVHPEEVEAVINRHPSVHLSLVRARRSPIVGAIVIAEVVLDKAIEERAGSKALENEILNACRAVLPLHKVPAAIHFVPALALGPAGKLVRAGG
ncbi:MAG: long-chain fatty acid--CoA ligase [Acetobacteraceae bacterium]|nr:long-chain fatty acid--CoA ligase [Acetobacteraceae bacterium]